MSHYETLILVIMSLALFFVAQWSEHYTHVLQTNIYGVYGVTEIQLTMVALHLTAYFFPAFLDPAAPPLLDLPALGLPFEMPSFAWFSYLFSCAVTAVNLLSNVVSIGMKYKGSISLVLPILLSCGAAMYLTISTELCGERCHRPEDASLYTTLLILTVGFTCTQSSNRIIIASVAKVPYTPSWQIGHVLLIALAAVVSVYGDHSVAGYQYPLLLLAFVVSVVTTFRHCIGAANELCDLLGIRLFVIPVPSAE